VFAQMIGQPETRKIVADKLHLARTGLAAIFLGRDEKAIDAETARTLGTFLHVLLSGLVLQWLIDAKSSPSGRDLTEALRATAAGLESGGKPVRAKSRAGKPLRR